MGPYNITWCEILMEEEKVQSVGRRDKKAPKKGHHGELERPFLEAEGEGAH